VIVATSALELGIDVGDLEYVLQIDAPVTVASFLQRMGRTGRREGLFPNCTFLALKDDKLLLAAGLLRLHSEGYVEPIHPNYRAAQLYAHQVMSLCIQTGGVNQVDISSWLGGSAPARDLTPSDCHAIIRHMLETQILALHDNDRLWLGPVGEERFGRANFRKLYAAFESVRAFDVRYATRSLGTVEERFLLTVTRQEDTKGPAAFMLGGKPWQVAHIDFDRGVVEVRPAEHAGAPRWMGSPRHLSRPLCQAIARVLCEDDMQPYWSNRAQARFRSLRAEYMFLREAVAGSEWQDDGSGIRWWNFAGGGANVLLAQMLEAELGERVSSSNLYVKLSRDAAPHVGKAHAFIQQLRRENRPNREDALRFASGAVRGRVSKFEICVPEPLLLELWAHSVLDQAGAREAVQT
jgi:ATP-dependent Lhr-like helicase